MKVTYPRFQNGETFIASLSVGRSVNGRIEGEEGGPSFTSLSFIEREDVVLTGN